MTETALKEFADKINQIMPVFVKEFTKTNARLLFKEQLSFSQFLILQLLYSEGESKMTALARFMRVTTAAMTGMVERLVRDHYLVRVDDPHDRRIIKVKLTPKVQDVVRKINQERRKLVINLFSKISEQDRKDYLRIVTQIKDILVVEAKNRKP
jgi:DNA-binding MarR family transcriptional regulator